MNENKNIFGIIYILIAMALFSVHDAILKYIFEKTSLYEIFFARTLIAALLSGGFLLLTKQKISLITHYPFLSIIRVVLHFLAFSFYFVSLTYLTLAVATALYFSTPFFMSIFARIFLKEPMTSKKIIGVSLAIFGAMIVSVFK